MLARARTRTRRGQVALITVFAVFTLLLLIAGVLNVTRVTATKMEQQNAADAAAHAAGIEMARGMNAVTALNHLIGELNALDGMAMAFGGLPLEEKRPITLPNLPTMDALKDALKWSGGQPPRAVKFATRGKSKSGGAIGDARKTLHPILEDLYRVHAAGGAMCTDPMLSQFAEAGRELVRAAVAIEKCVEHEAEVLDALEELAETKLIPLKQLCNHGLPKEPEEKWGIIPRLHKYQKQVVEETPYRAAEAAERVAKEYGAVGSLFPNLAGDKFKLELPVEREDIYDDRSQMVRAMTPWVQYWRRPILEYGQTVLRLSEFAKHYHKHSQEFTRNMARWQWQENETRLYRLKDLKPHGADKGREEWATEAGSDRANELFGVLGFALKPPPVVIGFPIFRQSQPDGIAAVAQVLIYNANPQDRPRKAKWQPVVGWDTLAWDNAVPEIEYGDNFRRELSRPRIDQPRVKLNWQAKLVPVATERATSAVGTQGPELNRILDRLLTDRPLVNTH